MHDLGECLLQEDCIGELKMIWSNPTQYVPLVISNAEKVAQPQAQFILE
jgi:hypothetical protein